MEHIWPMYGNDMGWNMGHIWRWYGFDKGYALPYETHRSSLSSFICQSIVLVYGIATYFVKIHTIPILWEWYGPITLSHGIGMGQSHINTIWCSAPFYGIATYFVKIHTIPIHGNGMVPIGFPWHHHGMPWVSPISIPWCWSAPFYRIAIRNS